MKKWMMLMLIAAMILVPLTALCEETPARELLQKGSVGPAVEKLAVRLAELGYYPLKIDADFGPGMRGAVKAFQRRSGLPEDGVATPEIQNLIYAADALAAPKQPMLVTRVAYTGGDSFSVCVRNDLDTPVDYISFCFVTYDVDGNVISQYPTVDAYRSEPFCPLRSYVTQAIVEPGAETCYTFKKALAGYVLKPTEIAVSVRKYHVQDGESVEFPYEKMSFYTNKCNLILPNDENADYIRATREQREEAATFKLGFHFVELPYYLSHYYMQPSGAYLTDVDEDSPAGVAGLKQGDVVLTLDGVNADLPDALEIAKAKMADGEAVVVEYWRNNRQNETRMSLNDITPNADAKPDWNTINGADAIVKYKSLLDAGVITQAEFDTVKGRIINGG